MKSVGWKIGHDIITKRRHHFRDFPKTIFQNFSYNLLLHEQLLKIANKTIFSQTINVFCMPVPKFKPVSQNSQILLTTQKWKQNSHFLADPATLKRDLRGFSNADLYQNMGGWF